MSNHVLNNVVKRTNGELYMGVVGPVRTGKSTFIRKFMETKVLPFVNDQEMYSKIQDELPQSSEGKSIMTVEPKFVPSNQIKIQVGEDINLSVRLVDCVGYVIPSSKGYLNEDGSDRLVQTPWFGEEIPFEEAALMGTKKVIESHSNIGIVITSDGSFTDFSRNEYELVESEIIEHMKELDKPFVIVLNTKDPYNENSLSLKADLEEKYNVKVVLTNVLNLTNENIDEILSAALEEFDIQNLNIEVPNWINKLDDSVQYKCKFNELINSTTGNYRKVKDVLKIQESFYNSELFENVLIDEIDPGTGDVNIIITVNDNLYQQIIEELIGEKITDKAEFIEILMKLKQSKNTHDIIGDALEQAIDNGYGLSVPTVDKMILDTPQLIKDGNRYGIKLKATAPVLEVVRLSVDASFEPIIGSKEQAEALINHMLTEFEENKDTIWNSEIFGRKLCDVIKDGIKGKIDNISEEIQNKFKNSLEKIINESKGGIIAIIL